MRFASDCRRGFADPVLAGGKRYAEMLRGYVRAEMFGPLPLRRLAAAYPQTVDAVFRKILRRRISPGPSKARPGCVSESPGNEREPRPGITVIGARLSELIGR